MSAALYDTIGKNYRKQRIPDPRIASAIFTALGEVKSVANVGAGAGSYEPPGTTIVAIDPSMTMIRQRPDNAAPALCAIAEQLPLRDKCVEAALAVLTLHHWQDVKQGLAELRRVATDRVVILTYDPGFADFWLTSEYFPEITAKDRLQFPPIDAIISMLGRSSVQALPVPKDCMDGFLGAYWARPTAYLEPEVRSGMSGFAGLKGLDDGLRQLARDIDSGAWHKNYGHLMDTDQLDVGYRLIVAALR